MTEIRRATSFRRSLRLVRSDSDPAKRHVRATRASGVSTSTAPVSMPLPTWASRYRSRLVVTDLAVICVAVFGAFLTRFSWEQSPAYFAETAASYSAIVALITVSWVIALAALHTRDSRVVGLGVAEYRGVVSASVLAFGLLGIAFLALEVNVARGFFLLALPIGLVGLLLNRWLWRKWLMRQRRAGNFVSRAIVVGSPVDVRYVINQITAKATLVYDIVGAAVDGQNGDSITTNSRTVAVVSGLDSVAKVAAQLRLDAVIVAGQPGGGNHYIRDLGWDLEGTGAELVVASSLTNVAGPRIHFRPVEGLPLMHVELPHYEGGKHLLKRALDVAVSGVAIVALMPLMVVIGILVRRDSEGPALFRQERVGKGGRVFHMLKFRSMVLSAEDDLACLLEKNEGSGVLFKIRHDPRVTRVGRVLRKYSLDELPQLWNILLGEMSLVGPRPPLMSEVASYEDRVHRRLFIKPGLTGMWQVNGRSNLDWEESVRLDLYYVENWSLTGDLVIIWRTFRVLMRPVGAY